MCVPNCVRCAYYKPSMHMRTRRALAQLACCSKMAWLQICARNYTSTARSTHTSARVRAQIYAPASVARGHPAKANVGGKRMAYVCEWMCMCILNYHTHHITHICGTCILCSLSAYGHMVRCMHLCGYTAQEHGSIERNDNDAMPHKKQRANSRRT